ncbi:unnamed protein product [Somion occarium]|uniref:Uncharacterized protein n=1 Tax=Somion occarium TaxID=3059160 RepID=A0ABP1CJ85_9APHY
MHGISQPNTMLIVLCGTDPLTGAIVVDLHCGFIGVEKRDKSICLYLQAYGILVSRNLIKLKTGFLSFNILNLKMPTPQDEEVTICGLNAPSSSEGCAILRAKRPHVGLRSAMIGILFLAENSVA